MKSGKRRHRLGMLAFFIPLILIVSLVVYGYFEATAPGTLRVEALAINKYARPASQSTALVASATVGTTTEATPYSLTLSPGAYTVTFNPIPWYNTPAPDTVSVIGHVTAYAIGSYPVAVRVIEITAAGFNSSAISALHDVTPVVWINKLGTSVSIGVEPYGTENLQPGQNFTVIYQKTGTYDYGLSSSSTAAGTVVVT